MPVNIQGSVAAKFLCSLTDLNIETIFANAGTDFAPLIEASIALRAQGKRCPDFVTVPHENVAVAMAIGHYRATGQLAVVMVHTTVGTANALCGIMNAFRDHVPLLLVAGRTPHTESGLAASRRAMIHWGQDTFDQGGVVREYTKWDYELRSGQDVAVLLQRAVDISMTLPFGPTYLTLPREVLDEPAVDSVLTLSRAPGVVGEDVDPAVIRAVADAVGQAQCPVLLTSFAGRDLDSFEAIATLAEEFSIGVVQPFARDLNMAAAHPMNLGTQPQLVLDKADLVLVVDCEVPWVPDRGPPNPSATIIHCSSDPFFRDYPIRGFPADMAIAAPSRRFLEALLQQLRSDAAGQLKVLKQRSYQLQQLRQVVENDFSASRRQIETSNRTHPIELAECLNEHLDASMILVNELAVTLDSLNLQTAGSYIAGSHAGGLGFGLGAALGIKRALPEKMVITLTGNGSYLFGNPVSAHFVGQAEQLPTLTIIANNERWHSVHSATAGMYPDGYSVNADTMPLVDLAPSPEFHKVIETCGGVGRLVESVQELPEAMAWAIDLVTAGRSVLLNVLTDPWDRV
ncbi:MAG: thiamine pyrophosphate-requiring protein [Gammaproteobacteria bacterium]|nr:thiamine pyrophosphate-requiring protein [Gammaproteobacteria bacterium]MBT5203664.1 thiamine pyrophosphate-requiring protein [Gammaproteobacteria bacterium]MBT5603277.1 thiamine pyrophosphate-requiring protein [Gammaproteobacteria bacterium]MBT6244737.1 thiamine pyrophosphate-requiring protein [Gammaproteobacteria bacterium]